MAAPYLHSPGGEIPAFGGLEPAFDAFQAHAFDGGAQEAVTEPWDVEWTCRQSDRVVQVSVPIPSELSCVLCLTLRGWAGFPSVRRVAFRFSIFRSRPWLM